MRACGSSRRAPTRSSHHSGAHHRGMYGMSLLFTSMSRNFSLLNASSTLRPVKSSGVAECRTQANRTKGKWGASAHAAQGFKSNVLATAPLFGPRKPLSADKTDDSMRLGTDCRAVSSRSRTRSRELPRAAVVLATAASLQGNRADGRGKRPVRASRTARQRSERCSPQREKAMRLHIPHTAQREAREGDRG